MSSMRPTKLQSVADDLIRRLGENGGKAAEALQKSLNAIAGPPEEEDSPADVAFRNAIFNAGLHYLEYGKVMYGDAWYNDPYRKMATAIYLRKFVTRLLESLSKPNPAHPDKFISDMKDLAVYAIMNLAIHMEEQNAD